MKSSVTRQCGGSFHILGSSEHFLHIISLNTDNNFFAFKSLSDQKFNLIIIAISAINDATCYYDQQSRRQTGESLLSVRSPIKDIPDHSLASNTNPHSLSLDEVPEPKAGPNDLIINVHAAALNHRDLFLRQHLYPAISFDVPLLADGCGVVSATGSSVPSSFKNKRVILTPGRGWDTSPTGPEAGSYSILGGTSTFPIGTLQDVVCVEASEVELAPEHLSDAEAAALPLTGLTAWRAFVSKSDNAIEGRNILITGIGGGVALNVLQFAVAKGCNVFVTSGSEEKIKRAKDMGAVGGVNYKKSGWEKDLLKLLPKERPLMDAVIDGAGGDIMRSAGRILKV